jgi:ribonuclease J
MRSFEEIGPAKLLICDTTNAQVPGWTDLEYAVEEGLLDVILSAKGRKILSCISSHLPRVLTINKLAGRLGQTISIIGKSFAKTIEAAEASGLSMPAISLGNPDADIIIVTGCQADYYSVLEQLSWGRTVEGLKIEPGDTVVHSTRPIPGRYWPVTSMLKRLRNLGATVVIDTNYPAPDIMYRFPRRKIHCSGHGYQEDIRVAIENFRPDYFLPYHSGANAMMAAADLAWKSTPSVQTERIILSTRTTFTINW